jgi:hypothetical protein
MYFNGLLLLYIVEESSIISSGDVGNQVSQPFKKKWSYSSVNLGVLKFLDSGHERERCWTEWQQSGSLIRFLRLVYNCTEVVCICTLL